MPHHTVSMPKKQSSANRKQPLTSARFRSRPAVATRISSRVQAAGTDHIIDLIRQSVNTATQNVDRYEGDCCCLFIIYLFHLQKLPFAVQSIQPLQTYSTTAQKPPPIS
jgi:hypothetical protein